ncbi:MAG: hypothetical protein HC802_07305 [Caldilineaceae bacterium]|nr:hypothetical protein [Caldilineaceae bacterium]
MTEMNFTTPAVGFPYLPSSGGVESRGKAQHVLSGEVAHFRTWLELSEFLTERLHELEPLTVTPLRPATPRDISPREET